jgi:hypothetical protein
MLSKMKKGIALSMEKLGFLIIIIAVMIITINIMTNYLLAMDEKAITQSCKDSVVATSIYNKMGPFELRDSVRCPIQTVKNRQGREDKIIDDLAESTVKCWDMFGEGKLDLFKGDGTFCAFCYVISFDKKGVEISKDNIMRYMSSQMYRSKGMTYMSYLVGYETDFSSIPLLDYINEDLDTDNSYGTLYYHSKKNGEIDAKMYLIQYDEENLLNVVNNTMNCELLAKQAKGT